MPLLQNKGTGDWFADWFNSPYYHLLYKNRDHREAAHFIDNLVEKLHILPEHQVMDLACGKGRHSIYLNTKGFDVTGVDLSEQNILAAKAYENQRLHFYIHDMREVFRRAHFDYILNLFTSFGYFPDYAENLRAVQAMEAGLKDGGMVVLDFLNARKVINNLVPEEEKEVEGIIFHIIKTFEDGYIVKNIRFTDKGRDYHFQERVKAITEEEFREYFRASGLEVSHCYGDYDLNSYEGNDSDRMIFLAKKGDH